MIDTSAVLFWENQNVKRPSADHYSMSMNSMTPIQNHTRHGMTTAGMVETVGWSFVLYVSYIGTGAMAKLSSMVFKMKLIPQVLWMHNNNLSLDNIENLLDITSTFNNQFEEKAAVDFIFRTTDKLIDSTIVPIEQITINGDVNDTGVTISNYIAPVIPEATSYEITLEMMGSPNPELEALLLAELQIWDDSFEIDQVVTYLEVTQFLQSTLLIYEGDIIEVSMVSSCTPSGDPITPTEGLKIEFVGLSLYLPNE
jgi:hypothetical protein